LRTDTAHPQPPFPLIIPSVGLVSRWLLFCCFCYHRADSAVGFFVLSFWRETRNFCVAAVADRITLWLITEFLYGFVVSVFGC
jgi:hypothetical protein